LAKQLDYLQVPLLKPYEPPALRAHALASTDYIAATANARIKAAMLVLISSYSQHFYRLPRRRTAT
jgi:hypothetical protein